MWSIVIETLYASLPKKKVVWCTYIKHYSGFALRKYKFVQIAISRLKRGFRDWLRHKSHPLQIPGGRDCFSLSAFSLSETTNVYRYVLHRTLNLTVSLRLLFIILTDLASFRLAVSRKSLISLISRGILAWVKLVIEQKPFFSYHGIHFL